MHHRAKRSAAAPPTGSARQRTLRPGAATRWGLGVALLSYVVGMLASGFVVALSIGAGAARGSGTTIAAGMFGLWIGFVGGPLLASHAAGQGPPVEEFGIRLRWSDVPTGLISGIAAQLVAVPLASWPLQQLLGGDPSEPARDLLGPHRGSRWLIAGLVVIVAPLAEEIFFRGLVLRSLARHMHDTAAVIVSSAVFAATHYQVLSFPGLFVAGLLFAELTRRSGRLGPAIVAHAAFNATTVVVLLT